MKRGSPQARSRLLECFCRSRWIAERRWMSSRGRNPTQYHPAQSIVSIHLHLRSLARCAFRMHRDAFHLAFGGIGIPAPACSKSCLYPPSPSLPFSLRLSDPSGCVLYAIALSLRLSVSGIRAYITLRNLRASGHDAGPYGTPVRDQRIPCIRPIPIPVSSFILRRVVCFALPVPPCRAFCIGRRQDASQDVVLLFSPSVMARSELDQELDTVVVQMQEFTG
ncbi:hypothetical protein C8R45DRAFT_564332 [Mycena sanguinolenta]|nr:hypothetical protein C8R45DRAFT_564332 [Mycena sanguinolenta]